MRQLSLVTALVLSRVDYCNSSLAGLPGIALAPLQRVLNAASRYVAPLRSHNHMKLVQRSLHWLPIHQRIQYKLCILMYGAAHVFAPDYINLVTLTSATSDRSHLRSADSLTFDIPRTRTRMGDRADVHSRSLLHVPGMHFRLTFVVHPVWIL